jgi:hypothetical protein
MRHGGRLLRRNDTAALTRGDCGELKQRLWHIALDRGGDAVLGHGGEAGEALDRDCRLRTREWVGWRLYGAGAAVSARRGALHAWWR